MGLGIPAAAPSHGAGRRCHDVLQAAELAQRQPPACSRVTPACRRPAPGGGIEPGNRVMRRGASRRSSALPAPRCGIGECGRQASQHRDGEHGRQNVLTSTSPSSFRGDPAGWCRRIGVQPRRQQRIWCGAWRAAPRLTNCCGDGAACGLKSRLFEGARARSGGSGARGRSRPRAGSPGGGRRLAALQRQLVACSGQAERPRHGGVDAGRGHQRRARRADLALAVVGAGAGVVLDRRELDQGQAARLGGREAGAGDQLGVAQPDRRRPGRGGRGCAAARRRRCRG